MARPDDQDQVHGTGDDDYTADLPESSKILKALKIPPKLVRARKQSILERAKERAARAVGVKCCHQEGVHNLQAE